MEPNNAAGNAALEALFARRRPRRRRVAAATANNEANTPYDGDVTNEAFKEWFIQQIDNADLPPPDISALDFDMINKLDDVHFLKRVRNNPGISERVTRAEKEQDALAAIYLAICRITTLEGLILLNFKTAVPTEIGNLINLTALTIKKSDIERLPDEIGNLINLTSLNVFDNRLTEIPETIGNLSNLTQLVLNKNRLSNLPNNIVNLTGLLGLFANLNQLTVLPPNFSILIALKELSLSHNRIVELPEDFGNLVNLEYLSIANNQLTTLPPSFSNLKKLSDLSLNDNNIEVLPLAVSEFAPRRATIIYDLSNLTDVGRFNISNNPISAPIDNNNDDDPYANYPPIVRNMYEAIQFRADAAEAAAERRMAERQALIDAEDWDGLAALDAPPEEVVGAPAPFVPGIAYQVHGAFDKINKPVLFAYLNSEGVPEPLLKNDGSPIDDEDFAQYIYDTITTILNTMSTNNANNATKKTTILEEFNSIYANRLSVVSYDTETREMIRSALEYVKRQDDIFKREYAYYYTYDNFHAYEGAASLSCTKGMIERFVTTLTQAAAIVKESNPEVFEANNYEELIEIVSAPTIQEAITKYSQKCFQDERLNLKPTKAEKMAELKLCIKEKIAAKFGANSVTNEIDESINTVAQSLESMINNNNNTTEGGARRKKAKTRGKAKSGKTKRRGYRFRKTQKKHRK